MDHTHLKPAYSKLFAAASSINNLSAKSMAKALEPSLKLSSAYSEPFAAASSINNLSAKSVAKALEPLLKLSSAYSEPFAAASSINNLSAKSMTKALEPSLKLSAMYSEYYTAALKKPFVESMTQVLESVKKVSSYLESSSEKIIFPDLSSINIEAWETLDNGDKFPEDDFVTFDEKTIQEWNIPDTIAIPVGNKRIRMKTDIFIAILGSIIIPILFGIAGLIVDLHDAYLKAETESQRLEIEHDRNNLLQEKNYLIGQCIDILKSIDTSNSSEADEIEEWKESLLKPGSVSTTVDSDPYHLQESHDNSPE